MSPPHHSSMAMLDTLDHQPVQNSEVYVLGSSHAPSVPPPSPPSPATPCDRSLSPPCDDLMSMSMTPPESCEEACPTLFTGRLANAIHVLGTEATALSNLTRLYETDPIARRGFSAAIDTIITSKRRGGKLVICGVGKSGHIANKLVATMNSLDITSTYLHPTEALHGDLGIVNAADDVVLLITFSGKTPELLGLLPHFDAAMPVIIMTSHTQPSTCEIIQRRPATVLLPAPIHQSETDSFGFNAPTTSTTMAISLGDALAVTISKELHVNVQDVFLTNHPGGAIGQAIVEPKEQRISDLAHQLVDIPAIAHSAMTGSQVLMTAYKSRSGWVRHGEDVISPRRVRSLHFDDFEEPAMCIPGLIVPRMEWVEIAAHTELHHAREWLRSVGHGDDTILFTSEDGEITGVMEAGDLLV